MALKITHEQFNKLLAMPLRKERREREGICNTIVQNNMNGITHVIFALMYARCD